MTHYDEGRHYVELGEVFFGESQQKKTPYIGIRFTPKDGTYQRDVKLWLTSKTVDRVVAILRGLGWKGSKFQELTPDEFDSQTTELDCTHDNGYENWEFPPPAKADAEPSNPGVARKLDALFGAELRKGAEDRPQIEDPVGSVSDDDSIPF